MTTRDCRVAGRNQRQRRGAARLGARAVGKSAERGGAQGKKHVAPTTVRERPKLQRTIGEQPGPPLARVQPNYGFVNTLLLAVATFAFVAASWTFRSTLKSFDEACQATEKASKATEKASKEVETLSLQLEKNIPVTLAFVENASLEVEILSKGLQSLTGAVNKNIRQPVQDAVAATVDTSTNVMKRVPNDLAFVSDVATMVLGEWRSRLGDTIGNIDTTYFRKTRAQREATDWIESYRERTAAMDEETPVMGQGAGEMEPPLISEEREEDLPKDGLQRKELVRLFYNRRIGACHRFHNLQLTSRVCPLFFAGGKQGGAGALSCGAGRCPGGDRIWKAAEGHERVPVPLQLQLRGC